MALQIMTGRQQHENQKPSLAPQHQHDNQQNNHIWRGTAISNFEIPECDIVSYVFATYGQYDLDKPVSQSERESRVLQDSTAFESPGGNGSSSLDKEKNSFDLRSEPSFWGRVETWNTVQS